MAIFSGKMLRAVMARLEKSSQFKKEVRGLTGTITFREESGCAHLSYYQGCPVKAEDGVNPYGSEFLFTASEEEWEKALRDDRRKGIFEYCGETVNYDGNLYTLAAYSKAFFLIWDAVRMEYLRGESTAE